MNEFCLQCAWENGTEPLSPRPELKGKLITFTCKGCGSTLVDWEYQCWGSECSKNHMEMRLGENNSTSNTNSNVLIALKLNPDTDNTGQLTLF